MHFLALSRSISSIGCYLCLFMQTQLQLGSYIHECTNKTNSLSNLQDLILTLSTIIIGNTIQGLNLVDLPENVFHLCMHGYNYPARIVCLHEQTQIVTNASCRVVSQ